MSDSYTRVRLVDPYSDAKRVELFEAKTGDGVARMAAAMLEKFGLIAAEPNGYDKAGRQEMRLIDYDYLVRRAFDIAEEFFSQAERRNHLLDVPDPLDQKEPTDDNPF